MLASVTGSSAHPLGADRVDDRREHLGGRRDVDDRLRRVRGLRSAHSGQRGLGLRAPSRARRSCRARRRRRPRAGGASPRTSRGAAASTDCKTSLRNSDIFRPPGCLPRTLPQTRATYTEMCPAAAAERSLRLPMSLRPLLSHLTDAADGATLARDGGAAFVSASLRPYVLAALADEDTRPAGARRRRRRPPGARPRRRPARLAAPAPGALLSQPRRRLRVAPRAAAAPRRPARRRARRAARRRRPGARAPTAPPSSSSPPSR